MLRYRLRTLLIVLALGPPLLALGYWGWLKYADWRERQVLEQEMREMWEQGTRKSVEY